MSKQFNTSSKGTEITNMNVECIDEISAAPIKKEKKKANQASVVKNCKVLFYNKYSKNFAFEYDGRAIQITLPACINKCGTTVNVQYKDGKYTVI